MKELHLKAVKAYIEMLTLHIDSKTMSRAFHKETEEFYEKLFTVAHEIGEKHVDLGGKLSGSTLEEKQQEAHNIIVNLKKEVESYKENNKVSLGTEDLLGTLASDLEDMEGSSRVFL
jgi:DNA-binding ferritin-like protein